MQLRSATVILRIVHGNADHAYFMIRFKRSLYLSGGSSVAVA